MDIQKLHNDINALMGKDQSAYFPPNIIDAEIYKESNNIYNGLREQFEATQIISDKLRLFAKTVAIPLTDGKGAIEGLHPISVYDADGNACSPVITAAWHLKTKDPMFGAEADQPIYRIWDNVIWVLPLEKVAVTVEYLKAPVEPKFNYTIVNDKYVYNAVDSVDVEFPDILMSDLVNRVAGNLGMQIRQGDMVQYANMEEQKEL
jgi:hypothetical protein